MKLFGYLKRKIAELFQKDRTVIGRHINNIFKEGELEESLVCAKFAHTKDYGRREGFTQRTETTLYNLDVIISVGYRVKSKRGTQFRIWANKILKQYLLQGYAINERIASQKFDELSQLVKVLGRTIQNQEKFDRGQPFAAQCRSGLYLCARYARPLRLSGIDDRKDHTPGSLSCHLRNAMEVIRQLHEKFGGSPLFGNEKDDSFKSSIGQIYQTWRRGPYPSVEEKAAMLLYLVTKNHSFSDGNKRIAATLFLWFLNGNGILYNEDGTKRIADNTLVALTLMIAESRTEERTPC